MIIRINYGDNDFCNEIESFCSGLRDRMFHFNEEWPPLDSPITEENIKLFNQFFERMKAAEKLRERLMNPENHFKPNSREYCMICDEVLRLWREFTPTAQIIWEPHISIQYSLDEKWENAKVVYYFTAYDKCIIQ